MGKQKLSLQSILNFVCILFFTTVVVCYLSAFFRYNDGNVASIHDLVGFPADHPELQEYILDSTNSAAYVYKGRLNYNAFVYAPILMILTSIAGIITYSFKIKSENLGIYSVIYGLIGILSFSLVDIMRLGKNWRFQLALFIIVFVIGIAQIILRFFVKKEIEFDADVHKLRTYLIAGLSVVSIVSIILFTTSNLKVKKQQWEIEHPATVEGTEEESNKTEEYDEAKLVKALLDGTSVNDIIAMIENDEIKLQDKDEILEELKNYKPAEEETEEKTEETVAEPTQKPETTSSDVTLKFNKYTVAEGDTLIDICEANGIDYYENKGIIMYVNNLESASVISVGQEILLPVAE